MSPACACCFKRRRRSPERSTATASCRPFRVCRGRRQRKPLFCASRHSAATSRSARRFASRSRPAAAAASSSADQRSEPTARPRPLKALLAPSLGPAPVIYERADLKPPRNQTSSANGARCPASPQTPWRTLDQPSKDSKIARARSASWRSGERASVRNSSRCSAVATTRGQPAMTSPKPNGRSPSFCHMWIAQGNAA